MLLANLSKKKDYTKLFSTFYKGIIILDPLAGHEHSSAVDIQDLESSHDGEAASNEPVLIAVAFYSTPVKFKINK